MSDSRNPAQVDQERRDRERVQRTMSQSEENRKRAEERGTVEKQAWDNEMRRAREEYNRKYNPNGLNGYDPIPGSGATPMYEGSEDHAVPSIDIEHLSSDKPTAGLYKNRNKDACFDMHLRKDGSIEAVLRTRYAMPNQRHKETLEFAMGFLGATGIRIDWPANASFTPAKIKDVLRYIEEARKHPEKPMVELGDNVMNFLRSKEGKGLREQSGIFEKLEELKKEHAQVHQPRQQAREAERQAASAGNRELENLSAQTKTLGEKTTELRKTSDQLIDDNHKLQTTNIGNDAASQALIQRELTSTLDKINEAKALIEAQKTIATENNTLRAAKERENNPKLGEYDAKINAQAEPREKMCIAAEGVQRQMTARLAILEQKIALLPQADQQAARAQLDDMRNTKMVALNADIREVRAANQLVQQRVQAANQNNLRPPAPGHQG